MLTQVLMPALRRGLRLPVEKDALRNDIIMLLAATLLAMPSLQPELATLLSPKEPEADFFFNLTHVQMPRRQRALARLAVRVRDGAFSATTLSNYLLPLLRHLVLRETPKEIDVAEEAVMTLKEVAKLLPWRPFLSTLQGFARLLKLQPRLEKRLVRAMVGTLEGFHFELTTEVEEDEEEAQLKALRAPPAEELAAVDGDGQPASTEEVATEVGEGAGEDEEANEAEEDAELTEEEAAVRTGIAPHPTPSPPTPTAHLSSPHPITSHRTPTPLTPTPPIPHP